MMRVHSLRPSDASWARSFMRRTCLFHEEAGSSAHQVRRQRSVPRPDAAHDNDVGKPGEHTGETG